MSDANALQTKEKVRRLLTEKLGSVQVDQDGDFTFPFGTTRIFIRVLGDGDRSFVRLTMPLLMDADPSPELFKYVATEGSYRMGHLAVFEKDGRANVFFNHVLLGDYLDAEELHLAIGAMVNSGDELDNELQTSFGGRKFHEDAEEARA